MQKFEKVLVQLYKTNNLYKLTAPLSLRLCSSDKPISGSPLNQKESQQINKNAKSNDSDKSQAAGTKEEILAAAGKSSEHPINESLLSIISKMQKDVENKNDDNAESLNFKANDMELNILNKKKSRQINTTAKSDENDESQAAEAKEEIFDAPERSSESNLNKSLSSILSNIDKNDENKINDNDELLDLEIDNTELDMDLIQPVKKFTTSPLNIKPEEELSFSTLLRRSNLMDLGDPQGKIVFGKIFQVVNNDLYIDFGWKFHCVCTKPMKNSNDYVRGAKVRLRIKELELSTLFLGATKDVTLLEADCTLLGLVTTPSRIQKTNRDSAIYTEMEATSAQ